MRTILQKLQSLKTEFDSVITNSRFTHPDEIAQSLGEKIISERFSEKLEKIINELITETKGGN